MEFDGKEYFFFKSSKTKAFFLRVLYIPGHAPVSKLLKCP